MIDRATIKFIFGLMAAAFVALGAILFGLECARITVRMEIQLKAISYRDGFSYAAPIVPPSPPWWDAIYKIQMRSDGPESLRASELTMLENGERLGPAHSIHMDIQTQGLGRYSHWNDAIIFSTRDNTDPRINGRVYEVSAPLHVAPWIYMGLVFCGTALFAFLYPARARRIFQFMAHSPLLFLAAGLALVGYYDNVYLGAVPPMPVPSWDSQSYFGWKAIRTIGYPLFLSLYGWVVDDWQYFPLFQLNLLIASLVFIGYGLARLLGNFLHGWAFLVLIGGSEYFFQYPVWIMTEAVFAALLCWHIGSVLVLLQKFTTPRVLLSGITLAAVILVKSIGIVFLVSLILLAAYFKGRRRLAALGLLVAPIGAYLGPSCYNYVHYQTFESSLLGGFALAGHVGWNIKRDDNSLFPLLAQRIGERLTPVVARRPPVFPTLRSYADYTSGEYNELLWQNILPEAANYLHEVEPTCPVSPLTAYRWGAKENRCWSLANQMLLRLAKDAIQRDFAAYAYHVYAHYYAMWQTIFLSDNLVSNLRNAVAWATGEYAREAPYWRVRVGPKVVDSPHQTELTTFSPDGKNGRFADARQVLLLSEGGIWVIEWLGNAPWLIWGLSLIGCTLVFALGSLSPVAMALCYVSLIINAYIGGHALVQVALPRYAAVAQPFALTVFLLATNMALVAAWNAGRIVYQWWDTQQSQSQLPRP